MAITRTGSVTQIGTVATSFYFNDAAQLERLGNGNLVAVFGTGVQDPLNPFQAIETLRSIVINEAGQSVSSIQTIGAATTSSVSFGSFEIGSLTNGTYMVSWEFGTDGGPADSDIFARIYTGTGTAVGAQFAVPVNLANGEFTQDVIGLANGNFLVTWSDLGTSTYPNLDANVLGQIFSASGARVGSEFIINSNTANLQIGQKTLALSDGRILSIWQDASLVIDPATNEISGIVNASLEFRFLTAAGAPTGVDATLLTPTSGFRLSDESGAFDIVALANGGFAIVWSEDNSDVNETAATYNLKAQVFNSSGVSVGAANTISTISNVNTTNFQDPFENIEVQLLPNGAMLVSWLQSVSGVNNSDPFVAGLSTTGAVTLSPTALESINGPYAGDILSVEVLPSGQLMGLAAQSNGAGQLTYNTVFFSVSVASNRIDGTANADPYLPGSVADDQINGLGGNDFLDGLGGNDELFGGAGNDTIIGGAGVDTISGGADNDYLYIQANDAVVDGGAGYDAVFVQDASSFAFNVGAAGVEWVYGWTGNNVLNAATSATAVALVGEAGADQLIGSAFNDYIYFDALDTLVDAGAGYDAIFVYQGNGQGIINTTVNVVSANAEWVLGGAGNDTIFNTGRNVSVALSGGAGNDTITGGLASDYLYGNAGNDVFVVTSNAQFDALFDIVNGEDKINVQALGATFDTFAEIQAVATAYGANSTLLNFGGGNQLLLYNFTVASLDASDFVF